MCFLKKRPKKDGLGKFNSSEICNMVISVVLSIYFVDEISTSFIHEKAVRPVRSFMIVERYLGVKHILLA